MTGTAGARLCILMLRRVWRRKINGIEGSHLLLYTTLQWRDEPPRRTSPKGGIPLHCPHCTRLNVNPE